MYTVTARKSIDGGVYILMPNGKCVRFDRSNSSKPDYRCKYVTINCYRYSLLWDK